MSDLSRTILMSLLLTAFLVYSSFLYLRMPVRQGREAQEADQGKLTWQRYNCVACHQVYGLGGYLGPDLTNVYSRRSEAYIRTFLQHGTSVMPNFNLSASEIRSLLAFFQQVDQSGQSDPRTFKLQPNGTIRQ